MIDSRRTPRSPATHASDWILVRGDGSLGSARRIITRLLEIASDEPRIAIITPGPRWVPEPHMEATLASVLEADPGLDGVVGWWRWADARPEGDPPPDPAVPATVRVGGPEGDDLLPVDLLSRPMSVGPIAVRARSLSTLARLSDIPADAVLESSTTWLIATALVGAHARIGSLPRTCSTRTRTVAEDPESLRPIGLAWLTQFALDRIGPAALQTHERRELLARWQAAPQIAAPAGARP